MQSDFSMFKHALRQLKIGQQIRLSGKDQEGNVHSVEAFIVKTVDENELLTTTGLVFHHSQITHIGFTETIYSPEMLPHLNLTGTLETFPSEPE